MPLSPRLFFYSNTYFRLCPFYFIDMGLLVSLYSYFIEVYNSFDFVQNIAFRNRALLPS
jgi:hypothetical protein